MEKPFSLESVMSDHEVLVIILHEDHLDADNVLEFKDAIQATIQGKTRVVVDMSAVKVVDSSGLGALISCLRLLNSQRGDFKLCAMSKTIRALFDLMRMQRLFSIYASREDAVGSFAEIS